MKNGVSRTIFNKIVEDEVRTVKRVVMSLNVKKVLGGDIVEDGRSSEEGRKDKPQTLAEYCTSTKRA